MILALISSNEPMPQLYTEEEYWRLLEQRLYIPETDSDISEDEVEQLLDGISSPCQRDSKY